MKPKKTLHYLAPAAAFASVVFAMSSSLQAATFTWTGASTTSNSWNAPSPYNWTTAPTFNNTSDLVFNVLTRPNADIGAARTIKSITYGADIDSTFATSFRVSDGGATANLTMDADTGNAKITVDSGASGNITLGNGGGAVGGGALVLNDNLDITHNGTGEFLINRHIQGSFGFTKSGTGTMRTANTIANAFTGAVNVNQGKLIANNTATATGDFGTNSGINLGGGVLEIRTSNALDKTITPSTTVSAASTLAYNNTTAATQTLLLSTGSMQLDATLKVQNISTVSSLNNLINISRNITGSGDLIVETYNNLASSASNFTLGRVQLSGDNSLWSGDLVIAKGTAQLSGGNSSGTGGIVIGTTGDSLSAGLAINQNTDLTLTNDLTVRTGGIRAIKNNGTSAINIALNGGVTLEGNLTVDHSLDAGKSITLGGVIAGTGGLNVARSGGSTDSFLLMTGSNTYTGATTVSSGRLTIGSTATINSTSGVTIGAGEFRYNSSTALSKAVAFSTTGGTLSGTGSIASDVNITVGNALAIGDGTIGTMSFGGVLTIGGTYFYELNSSTSAADLGDVTGNLTLGGLLDLIQLGAYAAGSKFTLFAYDGTLSGTFSGIADDATFTDGGGLWTMNYNDTTAGLNGGISASNTYITITAIPEPNGAALLGGLGVLALMRRRRA